MTDSGFYSQIKVTVQKCIEEFPYIILNDLDMIVNDEVLKDIGVRIVNYRGENDYSNARLNFEMAKSFQAEQTIFIFQHESADEYFTDLCLWFEWIYVDKIALEYVSKIVNLDIPEPLTPLIVFIIENDLTSQLESICKKNISKESSLDFLTNLLLSVILDEDLVSVKDDSQKIERLFNVVLCSEKIKRARNLLEFREGRDFIEKAFSINKLISKSLTDEKFREKLCSAIVGIYLSKKFEEAKREKILPLLFERFGFGGKEERKELDKLFETIKDIFSSLFEVSVEPKILDNIDNFIRDNEKLWFEGISLDNSSNSLSTHLSSEFEFISKQISETLKKLPPSVKKISEIFENLKSWPLIKGRKNLKKQIENLDDSISLLKILNSFPKKVPQSWEEWCGIYEHIILCGDKSFQREVQEPSLLYDEAWKIISQEYTKIRSKFVDEYEQFLKREYPEWIKGNWNRPVINWEALDHYIKSLTKKYETIFIILCDGMRWDFWAVLKQNLEEDFQITEEKICSLIPSTTCISRRAIFSGVLPSNFEDITEKDAIEKELGVNTTWTKGSKIDFKDLRELSKSTNKLRIFIYSTTEILHEYHQSLTSALGGFKDASRELCQNLKDVVQKANKPVVVIMSDHGFTEISEILKFPKDLYNKIKRNFDIKLVTIRCWVLGENPSVLTKLSDIDDLKKKIKNVFKDKIFMFDPKELALTRNDDTILLGRETVFRPFLVIIPKNFCYISRKEYPFAHGGLTPYETIIPFATLVPK